MTYIFFLNLFQVNCALAYVPYLAFSFYFTLLTLYLHASFYKEFRYYLLNEYDFMILIILMIFFVDIICILLRLLVHNFFLLFCFYRYSTALISFPQVVEDAFKMKFHVERYLSNLVEN